MKWLIFFCSFSAPFKSYFIVTDKICVIWRKKVAKTNSLNRLKWVTDERRFGPSLDFLVFFFCDEAPFSFHGFNSFFLSLSAIYLLECYFLCHHFTPLIIFHPTAVFLKLMNLQDLKRKIWRLCEKKTNNTLMMKA